jgi:hypothetical protein
LCGWKIPIFWMKIPIFWMKNPDFCGWKIQFVVTLLSTYLLGSIFFLHVRFPSRGAEFVLNNSWGASPLALGESSPSPFYMFPQINKKQITKERKKERKKEWWSKSKENNKTCMPKTNKISENISSHACSYSHNCWVQVMPRATPELARTHITWPSGPALTTTIDLTHSLTRNTISSPLSRDEFDRIWSSCQWTPSFGVRF